jgi:uncharacterized small protein (DUF1192 family)
MRGKASKIGDTRTSPNGYHYTRTPQGWKTTHTILMETKLGRPLAANERVRFVDNDKTNLDPDNLKVFTVREGSKARRIAQLKAKIEDLQAQLAELET